MEFIFIIIWVIAIISFITKAAKGANGAQNNQRQNTRYSGTQSRPQQTVINQGSGQTFRNVPSSTYGTTNSQVRRLDAKKAINQDRYAAASPVGSAYGQVKASRIGESSVLLEDRKNDWLAKQLREEALIYRRGNGIDLGATHNVNCEADEIKRGHARRHNSNGLDRQTFR